VGRGGREGREKTRERKRILNKGPKKKKIKEKYFKSGMMNNKKKARPTSKHKQRKADRDEKKLLRRLVAIKWVGAEWKEGGGFNFTGGAGHQGCNTGGGRSLFKRPTRSQHGGVQ